MLPSTSQQRWWSTNHDISSRFVCHSSKDVRMKKVYAFIFPRTFVRSEKDRRRVVRTTAPTASTGFSEAKTRMPREGIELQREGCRDCINVTSEADPNDDKNSRICFAEHRSLFLCTTNLCFDSSPNPDGPLAGREQLTSAA